jgi:hypothetical protein
MLDVAPASNRLVGSNKNTQQSIFSYIYPLNRVSSAWTTATNQPAWPGDTYSIHDCWGEQFGYDAWGNLLTISGVSSAYIGCTQESLSVMATAKNQISADAYDAAGNLTAIPGVATYTYDAENHIITAAGLAYSYDGDGKRVWKAPVATPTQPNKLYWYGAGSSPVIGTDGAGNFQYRYIFFNGMRVSREEANDWVDHYGLDALGNVRFVYGYNGASDFSEYYPFGGERVIQSGVGNHYKFTSKERDSESGNDYFGARRVGKSRSL